MSGDGQIKIPTSALTKLGEAKQPNFKVKFGAATPTKRKAADLQVKFRKEETIWDLMIR